MTVSKTNSLRLAKVGMCYKNRCKLCWKRIKCWKWGINSCWYRLRIWRRSWRIVPRGDRNIFFYNNISNNIHNNNIKTTSSQHTNNIYPPPNNTNLTPHAITNHHVNSTNNSKTIDSTKKSNDKCRTWSKSYSNNFLIKGKLIVGWICK